MRNLAWIIIAALALGGAWLLVSGKSLQELTGRAEDARKAPAEEPDGTAEAARQASEEAARAAEGAQPGGCRASASHR